MPSRRDLVGPSAAVAVVDPGQVGEVQRAVAAMCRSVGLGEPEEGRASIVATEAATNVVKHGLGGEVVLSPLRRGEAVGIEVLALDRGPGIPETAARAGAPSTVGTHGTGFDAIRRQSTEVDLFTLPGQGTALLSRIWRGAPPATSLDLAALCVAKPGESECGDLWSFEARPGGGRIVVADGLGHGPLAREAALAALRATGESPPGAARALEDAHRAARGTRGAAVAVVEVDLATQEIRFAGFGNVAGVLLDPDPEHVQSMVSLSGTAGQGKLKPREFTYLFARGTLLVVSSDGLSSEWSLEPYAGLALRHPGLVAGVLYRDHSPRRDDVTVVAARLGTRSLSP
jgi:anti-sigma regulatory factor (Ser/Thr protein kinase)